MHTRQQRPIMLRVHAWRGTRARRLVESVCRWACAALAITGPLIGQACTLGIAHAQQQASPLGFFLNVAPVMLAEPAARSPLPIQVGPQQALIRNSFVRIRGLPPAANLTEGHAISAGAWAVPLAGLASLGIVLPVGLQQGRWDVDVALVTIEGRVLTEAKTALVVGPVQLIAPPPREPQGQQGTSVVAATARPLAPIGALDPANNPELDRARGLYAKGKELLAQGNIQPARALFRRAAEAGLPESALALGGTYDPHELAKLKVVGLQPDPAAARRWYIKAQELGVVEADSRLNRLEAR